MSKLKLVKRVADGAYAMGAWGADFDADLDVAYRFQDEAEAHALAAQFPPGEVEVVDFEPRAA